jgi:hypothetical protein
LSGQPLRSANAMMTSTIAAAPLRMATNVNGAM